MEVNYYDAFRKILVVDLKPIKYQAYGWALVYITNTINHLEYLVLVNLIRSIYLATILFS